MSLGSESRRLFDLWCGSAVLPSKHVKRRSKPLRSSRFIFVPISISCPGCNADIACIFCQLTRSREAWPSPVRRPNRMLLVITRLGKGPVMLPCWRMYHNVLLFFIRFCLSYPCACYTSTVWPKCGLENNGNSAVNTK